MRVAPLLVAVLLASLVVVGAVLAPHATPPGRSAEHQVLLDLTDGLLAMQGADGSFDPFPDDPGLPEIRRTGPHALATFALARARALGVSGEVPGLAEGLDRALAVLRARQEPGGTFGSMPPEARNPWPSLDATASGTLAFLVADRPEDQPALRRAAAALQRASAYKVRDGWTRALLMMALAAIRSAGRDELVGGDAMAIVPVGDAPRQIDCNDYRLAAAIESRLRGGAGEVADRVLAACLEDPPAWAGQTSDLQAWWMQAWLAARLPGGAPFWAALRDGLRAALEAPPAGRVAGGWYADPVTQTACGILCLAEGLGGLAAR